MQPALDESLAELALLVHQRRKYDCYRENAGPLSLHGLDALHVMFGTLHHRVLQVVAHTRVCRELTVRNRPSDSRYSD